MKTERVDSVPHLHSRFTQAAAALRNDQIAQAEPAAPTTMQTWVPSDRHGRIPCIGLDRGAIPGSVPHLDGIPR